MRRIVLSTLALAFAVAGAVYATIPDAGGNVTICYSKSTSGLRIIDTSVTNCKSTETSLSWSVVPTPGPMGPAGPQGIAGPQGPAGPPGPAGGVAGVHRVFRLLEPDSAGRKTVQVHCPAGEVVLSAGYALSEQGVEQPPLSVVASVPLSEDGVVPRGWLVEAVELVPHDGAWSLGVIALCAPEG